VGLSERTVGTIKSVIAKLAMEQPRSWHTKLHIALWALRETCNVTTGVSPWFLAFGRNISSPCQILKESWLKDQILPLKMGSDSCQYLANLKADIELAKSYAQCHSEGTECICKAL